MILRWAETRLKELMQVRRGVDLTGARQVGKTTLSEMILLPGSSHYTLDDEEIRRAAADDPKGFVRHAPGETIVIDEVQKVPELLDAVKIVLDHDNARGQYLLTGSSNLRFAKKVRESLAGRLGRIRLRSLTLGEINGSRPDFLTTAFSRSFKRRYDEIDKRTAIRLAFEGGYPEPREFSDRERKAWFKTYLDDILKKDIQDITEVRKIPVLKSVATWLLAHSAQFFTLDELAAKTGISRETANNYMEALQAVYLFDQVEAFSKSDYDMIGKRPKRLASDAALMANFLGWSQEEVYLDESRNGKFIETWVYQQLAAIADNSGDYEITHYRDNRKREIDFIVERDDGAMLGVEVKTGKVSPSDFTHLKWFAKSIAKGPFTGVVVHAGAEVISFGDGLFAVPFSALG